MYGLDYQAGIHPDCGKKVKVHKDIIITPFYTAKFCDQLVKMSKFYNNKFSPYIVYGKDKTHELTDESPWDTLMFSRISSLLFEEFADHHNKYICPVLEKHFKPTKIPGLFSPMIIKYSRKGQRVRLHNDTSEFTLNIKLNTNYEGSDLEFPRQNWNNKDVPKGWCYIWPSTVTHPHQSTPLIKGTRYVLTCWSHPVSWSPTAVGGSMYRDV